MALGPPPTGHLGSCLGAKLSLHAPQALLGKGPWALGLRPLDANPQHCLLHRGLVLSGLQEASEGPALGCESREATAVQCPSCPTSESSRTTFLTPWGLTDIL